MPPLSDDGLKLKSINATEPTLDEKRRYGQEASCVARDRFVRNALNAAQDEAVATCYRNHAEYYGYPELSFYINFEVL